MINNGRPLALLFEYMKNVLHMLTFFHRISNRFSIQLPSFRCWYKVWRNINRDRLAYLLQFNSGFQVSALYGELHLLYLLLIASAISLPISLSCGRNKSYLWFSAIISYRCDWPFRCSTTLPTAYQYLFLIHWLDLQLPFSSFTDDRLRKTVAVVVHHGMSAVLEATSLPFRTQFSIDLPVLFL